MRTRIPTLLAAARDAVWAITPEKLAAVMEFLELRASGVAFTAEELHARIGDRSQRPVGRTAGSVAVIPIDGVIAPKMDAEMALSGGTSCQAITRAFDEAMANPDVSAIVLDVDSPGGAVEGVPELAAHIFKARGQGKRITAVANHLMASAAYWIASAADEVVAAPSATVGSIGVFTQHVDTSEADAKEGVKRTIMSAGKYKHEAAPGMPLSDEAKAAKQARVDEMYGMFAGAVAKHRGVTASDVKHGYGEGRAVSASRAKAEGLVDRVATMEQVLAGYGVRAPAPRRMDAAVAATPIAAHDADAVADNLAHVRAIAASLAITPESLAADLTAALYPIDPTTALHATTDSAGGAAATGHSPPPLAPAPEAKEHTVPETLSTTAAQNGAVDSEAILAAERKRSSEIRALGREHDLTAEQIDTLVDSGASIDAASREILKIKRTSRSATPNISVGEARESKRPWETLGHYAMAVMSAGDPNAGRRDERLMAAAQGINQSVPSEGGFLVPPQFSSKLWDEASASPDDILSQTDQYQIEGESLTLNANAETSRATGSRFGGVRGYWINEADQITKSSPKVRQIRLEPQELAVLVYATDKSLRNSPAALQTFLTRAGGEEIRFLSNLALVSGTGAGQPKGWMTSGALISVAKETSQAAATINQLNVSKMWARMHPRARAGAVWYINADCEPQLDALSTVVTNVAGTENVGGYANKVFDAERRTLKGRPVVVSEFCETVGTVGDIQLVNPGWMATGVRGGIRQDVSMHLRFDYAEQAFRFMYELDGQPWLASAITPFKGSATQSAFVALATRS